MQPIDIIIIIAAASTVVGVIARSLWKKKQGIRGCGCETCPSKGACNTREKQDMCVAKEE